MYQVQSELSFNNAAQASQAGVAAIKSGETEFDLSALTTIDSSTIAALLEWQRYAAAQAKPLSFVGVPSNLLSLMKLYGVVELFNIASARH
jgi:phospholipid transport system transporter-binding protein